LPIFSSHRKSITSSLKFIIKIEKRKQTQKLKKKITFIKSQKKKNKTKCEKKNSHKPNKPFCYYNQKQISKILENE